MHLLTLSDNLIGAWKTCWYLKYDMPTIFTSSTGTQKKSVKNTDLCPRNSATQLGKPNFTIDKSTHNLSKDVTQSIFCLLI